mmetsp:Transcript_15864/g.49615  ORF Transcript_15864/g.49615 Transcript_15864/m.49615 type:complete len:206 (-) Transcript_15864:912-1529(-)
MHNLSRPGTHAACALLHDSTFGAACSVDAINADGATGFIGCAGASVAVSAAGVAVTIPEVTSVETLWVLDKLLKLQGQPGVRTPGDYGALPSALGHVPGCVLMARGKRQAKRCEASKGPGWWAGIELLVQQLQQLVHCSHAHPLQVPGTLHVPVQLLEAFAVLVAARPSLADPAADTAEATEAECSPQSATPRWARPAQFKVREV